MQIRQEGHSKRLLVTFGDISAMLGIKKTFQMQNLTTENRNGTHRNGENKG